MFWVTILFVAMALLGMSVVGLLLAQALDAVDDVKRPQPLPPSRRPRRDDLGARLLRASIEGPRLESDRKRQILDAYREYWNRRR